MGPSKGEGVTVGVSEGSALLVFFCFKSAIEGMPVFLPCVSQGRSQFQAHSLLSKSTNSHDEVGGLLDMTMFFDLKIHIKKAYNLRHLYVPQLFIYH